jgi:hypothetical protein
VCTSGEYTVTEETTTIYTFVRSGQGFAGTKRNWGKGSYKYSGQRRMLYSKVVQGPDPAPPEDYNTTEKLSSGGGSQSLIFTVGDKLRIELSVPGFNPVVARPTRKQPSRSWKIAEAEGPKSYTRKNCKYTERTNRNGGLTLSFAN